MDERKQLIADYRELLATDEDRAAYDQMIELAHRVFPYVEGHKFYCEHWYTNLFFNKIREFGALLAQHGFFPDAEDVFQLTHYELEAAIIDLMTSWSNGSAPRGPAVWPGVVAERKAAIAEWAKHDTPPALGPVPDVIDDPAIVMLWGITRESLDAWLTAGAQPNTNEISGFAASNGVVEGVGARGEIGRGDRPPAAGRHSGLPGHQSDLGADLPEDRCGGLGYRRFDEPCGNRCARIWIAGRGGHRHGDAEDQGWPAHPRRWRSRQS